MEIKLQPVKKRKRNFLEVVQGETKRSAQNEGIRCPQCAVPTCMDGCPLGIDIPGFIRCLREGDAVSALDRIKQKNPFPGICGRICTAPCEKECILSDDGNTIRIRDLERYAYDHGRQWFAGKNVAKRNGKKVAIIGSGPSGLAAGSILARRDCQVTIFDAFDLPGGVLRYGVPEFRAPRKVLEEEIEEIRLLGVEFHQNFLLGQTAGIQDLFAEGFEAILLALGTGSPSYSGLPGDNLGGVFYSEEFLLRTNRHKSNFSHENLLPQIGSRIAVLGGGNTAVDCARIAVRLGKGNEVILVYPRTEADIKTHRREIELAKEEGVKLEVLAKPVQIISNTNHFVCGLKCIRMDFSDANPKSESIENWEISPVPDSEFVIDVDTVVVAQGHQPNEIIKKVLPEIRLDEEGKIIIDQQTGMTSVDGVFACGNVVTGLGPLVHALASGIHTAEKVDKYLKR